MDHGSAPVAAATPEERSMSEGMRSGSSLTGYAVRGRPAQRPATAATAAARSAPGWPIWTT